MHENDLEATKMTLRDHFAGMAMQSLIQIGAVPPNPQLLKDGSEIDDPSEVYYFGNEPWDKDQNIGYDAYKIADAMLAVRAEMQTELPSSDGRQTFM